MKIVKLQHVKKDPATEAEIKRTLYHFEINREHYDQLDIERVTNRKNAALNFVLSSFTGKISEKADSGEWTEKELSKVDFHNLLKLPEMGIITSLFALKLQDFYGGADEVEVFLG